MTFSPSAGTIGFAHRGASAECRDNTLASFARALALGARALETDAWLSADGIVVLDHDGEFRRGLRRRPIRSLARDALPDHVASLADLYRSWGTNFELSIDVKDGAAAAPLLDVAREVGAVSRLWLCSPNEADLRMWRSLDADAHLVHSTTLRHLSGLRHPYRDATPEAMEATLAEHARRLAAEGVAAVNLHQQAWSVLATRVVQGQDVGAFAWDAQTRQSLTRLMGMGIDAVYSNDVALMMSVLG
ncbi:MAG: glycerophosphodiester phosphodiesterase [Actinomycetota bacterium]|nr:glycerophosphodiester phosphodiesterase [Actinomycetota bacterium]